LKGVRRGNEHVPSAESTQMIYTSTKLTTAPARR